MARTEIQVKRNPASERGGIPVNLDELFEWFDEHVGPFGSHWSYMVSADYVTYRFADPKAAMLFKLTYGGV